VKVYLKTDLAWAAGFIDGEGSFFIGRTRQGRWSYFRVQLKVTQCHEESLRKLQHMFGGYVYPEKKVYSVLTKRPGWKWIAADKYAERAARLTLPFLVVKRAQAELLLEMKQRKRRQGKRNLTPQELAERTELHERMKKLNQGEAA